MSEDLKIGYINNNKEIVNIESKPGARHRVFSLKCLLCGIIRKTRSSSLNSACLCTLRKNRVKLGQKFGQLEVVGSEFKDNNRKWCVPCRCLRKGCTSSIKSYSINHLINGDYKSCGCTKWGQYIIGYVENNRQIISEEGQADNRRIVKVKCLNLDCGKEVIGTPNKIITSKCTCTYRKFRTTLGQKFHYLTTVSSDYKDPETGIWMVRCDCSGQNGKCTTKNKSVPVKGLHTYLKSCGCYLTEKRFSEDPWLSSFKFWINSIKKGKHSNKLNFEQWKKLSRGNCYLCGAPPNQRLQNVVSDLKRSGIDRVNSSLGYSMENCRPCCKDHNIMKKDHSLEKFINLCQKVVNYYNQHNIIT